MGRLKDGNVELCRLIFLINKRIFLITCKITILEQFLNILRKEHGEFSLNFTFYNFGENVLISSC